MGEGQPSMGKEEINRLEKERRINEQKYQQRADAVNANRSLKEKILGRNKKTSLDMAQADAQSIDNISRMLIEERGFDGKQPYSSRSEAAGDAIKERTETERKREKMLSKDNRGVVEKLKEEADMDEQDRRMEDFSK